MVDKPETGLLGFEPQQSVQHLLFGIRDTVYGVDVHHVNEIVLLPELNSLAERTGHFIGAVNLRGEIVPVMDLELRFGRKLGQYSLNDYLLVLESGKHRIAVMVNDVLGVKQVDLSGQSDAGDDSENLISGATCIDRMVSVDDQIAMLLNINGLFSVPGPIQDHTLTEGETESLDFFAGASVADQSVFRRRADRLRQSSLGLQAEAMTSLAVAEINGEFYALELDFVREFFEVHAITPVPCCPANIIGNVNLRGDVMTVVDVRGHLNLPNQNRVSQGKVIIAQTEEMAVGVLVDALHGVIYLPAAEIASVTIAGNPSIKGTAPFRDTMMSIIDVPSLLSLESWMVDEEVAYR